MFYAVLLAVGFHAGEPIAAPRSYTWADGWPTVEQADATYQMACSRARFLEGRAMLYGKLYGNHGLIEEWQDQQHRALVWWYIYLCVHDPGNDPYVRELEALIGKDAVAMRYWPPPVDYWNYRRMP